MAGREFGPPPSRIQEFEITWRNWLYLVFKKIYKRTYSVNLPAFNSVSPTSNPMVDGLIGIVPIVLADDTTVETRNFSVELPENWVQGTDLIASIRFFNAATQTGVVTVKTQLLYLNIALLEVATGSTTLATTTTLANNVNANTLHVTADLIIPASTLSSGDSIYLRLERDVTDSCVGDVAYQVISINYTGFINHE